MVFFSFKPQTRTHKIFVFTFVSSYMCVVCVWSASTDSVCVRETARKRERERHLTWILDVFTIVCIRCACECYSILLLLLFYLFFICRQFGNAFTKYKYVHTYYEAKRQMKLYLNAVDLYTQLNRVHINVVPNTTESTEKKYTVFVTEASGCYFGSTHPYVSEHRHTDTHTLVATHHVQSCTQPNDLYGTQARRYIMCR